MNAARKSIATTDSGANKGRDVTVIGGGIGGLTSALAFAQRGAHVTLHEKAPALREYGAGLQVTPNGRRVLDALGVRLDPIGVRAEAVVPTDGLTGREIARFDLTDSAPDYQFVHRGDLLHALALRAKAAGVQVRLSSCLDAPDPAASLNVAADGLHSKLRAALNGDQAPFFTGQVAWRAIVKAEAEPVAKIWMLPGAHVVTYPMTAERLNIVAVQEQTDWAAEGWAHEDDPANLKQVYSHACKALRDILDAVEQVNLWGLFRRPVAKNWVADRLVLLGDAAHPTLPFLAQGANLAIEDAYVLARMTDEKDDLGAALARFQAKRQPRVTRAIAAANRNAVNYHLRGPRRAFSHLALKAIGIAAPGALVNRLGWLYDHDVTA